MAKQRMVLDPVRVATMYEREAFILERLPKRNCDTHGETWWYVVVYRPDEGEQAKTAVVCHEDMVDGWEW